MPIKYNGICSLKKSEISNAVNNNIIKELQITKKNTQMKGINNNNENVIASSSANFFQNKIEKQLYQPSLKTYASPQLSFDIPSDEENVMEWEHLEPPINKNVHVCKLSSAVDKERKTRKKKKNIRNYK